MLESNEGCNGPGELPMTTATVRINISTRNELRELARQTGKSMQALLEEAVVAYRRRRASGEEAPIAEAVPKSGRGVGLDELADDRNALAYQRLGVAFRDKNEGKYAAFCEGRLLAISADRGELLRLHRAKYPGQPCFVVRVTRQEKVARFRRPRRISKMSQPEL